MKKYVSVFVGMLCVLAAWSQTQHGYVKTRGRLQANGTTLPGVRLQGATLIFEDNSSATSGANGVFTFAVPGKTYCIAQVQKKGYQICDPDLLGKTYWYSANDLPVVMDTPDRMLADELDAARKIRRTLQTQLQEKEDEIAALRAQNKLTEEKYLRERQALYAAQTDNEQLIAKMAKRYATMDFDQLDDFHRQVEAYIQNGDLRRADSLLNTKGSMEELSAELDRMDETIRKDAEDLARRKKQHDQSVAMKAKLLEDFGAVCYRRHEICLLRYRNDSAAYWLVLRADKDTLNVEWQLEAGSFIKDYLADYASALRYDHRALRGARSQYGEKSADVATSYNNIGTVYESQGDYAQALAYYQKALQIRLDVLGEKHPEITTSYNNIGTICHYQGAYAQALEYYRKTLQIRLETWGEKHPGVALCYNNMGTVCHSRGDYAQALAYHQKALQIRLETLGEKHPEVAMSYNNLGGACHSQGDDAQALEYYQKALQILSDVLGEKHPEVALSYNNLGYIYASQGANAQALEYFQKALHIWQGALGEKHPNVAASYNNIAQVYASQGAYAQALECHQKALQTELEVFGAKHPEVAMSYNNIGYVYYCQGDDAQAFAYYQKALQIRLEVQGEKHPHVAASYNNIGLVYHSRGDYAQALAYLQKALQIQLDVLGEKHPEVAESYKNIGYVYWSAKAKGQELAGFREFTQPRMFVAITQGSDTPAEKAGMRGTYVVLEYEDWTADAESNLYEKGKEMQGKPKTLVVMQDGTISRHRFENAIGIEVQYQYVGKQEKQRILQAYKAWKKKQ